MAMAAGCRLLLLHKKEREGEHGRLFSAWLMAAATPAVTLTSMGMAVAVALPLPLVAGLLLLCALASPAGAQPQPQPQPQPATAEDPAQGVGVKVSFRPSVAIVVGIFTMIFSLTFLLLMYAKFCHPSSSSSPSPPPTTAPAPDSADAAEAEPGGVAKPVIESLPFFRFAALRGARQGLECAVCLGRFDDADLLRLLPRCRHAFHLDCVDRWLHSNASCPLCRTRVDADRFDPDAGDGGRSLLDIFVERVPSSRFEAPDLDMDMDRHKHRIVVLKSRWSDLNRADLMALELELDTDMSSGRSPSPDDDHFFIRDEDEEPRRDDASNGMSETDKKLLLEMHAGRARGGGGCSSRGAVDAHDPAAARMVSSGSGVRSMSEIVSLPRLRAVLTEEEMARRRWLPIARRTARWLAGRERRYVRGVDAQPSADAEAV